MRSGPTKSLPLSVLGTFKMFFTSTLIATIVDQTNFVCTTVHEWGGIWKFIPVSDDEICAYLWFCLLIAFYHLPSVIDYWKTDKVYHYSPVASRISYDWFFDIARYLHFTDNRFLPFRSDPTYDCLQKVCPVIDSVLEASMTNYKPSWNVCWRSSDSIQGSFKLQTIHAQKNQ